MRSQLKYLAALALLLGVGACADMSTPQLRPDGFDGECTRNSDCDSGLNCQYGICVSGPVGQETSISIQITPPAERSDLAPYSLRNLPIRTGESYGRWALNTQRNVFGDVVVGSSREPVRATIYFTSKEGIPGTQYTIGANTDSSGRYTALLPEGSYDITVVTARDDIPEFKTSVEVLPLAAPLSFVLPDTKEYIRWSGRLVRLDERQITRPVAGVNVWAVPADGSGQSTMATTDAEGNFAVWLHRDVREFRFQVRGGTIVDGHSDEEFIVPTSTFSPVVIDFELPENETQLWIPGELLVLNRLSSPVKTTGIVVNENGEPQPDAYVMATGRINELPVISEITVERAALVSRAKTNERGEYELQLQPGVSYQITAAGWHEEIALSSARKLQVPNDGRTTLENVNITLESMKLRQVSIRLGPSFARNINVEVSARMLNSETAPIREYDIPQDLLTSINVANAASEVFHIPLLNGLWEFTFSAPETLALPTTTVRWNLYTDSASRVPLQFEFPPGVVIAGTIHDERGEPLRGATLDVWQESPDGTPKHLGRATTLSDGEIRVVIPW